jgi:hypothetical protein
MCLEPPGSPKKDNEGHASRLEIGFENSTLPKIEKLKQMMEFVHCG